jgi:hypothetical protein
MFIIKIFPFAVIDILYFFVLLKLPEPGSDPGTPAKGFLQSLHDTAQNTVNGRWDNRIDSSCNDICVGHSRVIAGSDQRHGCTAFFTEDRHGLTGDSTNALKLDQKTALPIFAFGKFADFQTGTGCIILHCSERSGRVECQRTFHKCRLLS